MRSEYKPDLHVWTRFSSIKNGSVAGLFGKPSGSIEREEILACLELIRL
jgi:hypothetical protein